MLAQRRQQRLDSNVAQSMYIPRGPYADNKTGDVIVSSKGVEYVVQSDRSLRRKDAPLRTGVGKYTGPTTRYLRKNRRIVAAARRMSQTTSKSYEECLSLFKARPGLLSIYKGITL